MARRGPKIKRPKVVGDRPDLAILTLANQPKEELKGRLRRLQQRVRYYLSLAANPNSHDVLYNTLKKEVAPNLKKFTIGPNYELKPSPRAPVDVVFVFDPLIRFMRKLYREQKRVGLCECGNFFWDDSPTQNKKHCSKRCGNRAAQRTHQNVIKKNKKQKT